MTFKPPKQMPSTQYGSHQRQGEMREQSDTAFLHAHPDGGLTVFVADGETGLRPKLGKTTATKAAKTVKAIARSHDATPIKAYGSQAQLKAALLRAHQAARPPDTPIFTYTGSATALLAHVKGDRAAYAHTGDVFLLHLKKQQDGSFEARLPHDLHNEGFKEELAKIRGVRDASVKRAMALDRLSRNLNATQPTTGLGKHTPPVIQTGEVALRAGDVLLAACDGLTQSRLQTILNTTREYCRKGKSATALAQRLATDADKASPESDNVTVAAYIHQTLQTATRPRQPASKTATKK